MLNLTGKDLSKASEAVPKENIVVKFEQQHRDFKVETSAGVQVGDKGDYLLQFEDGDYAVATAEDFDAQFKVSKQQTAKEYLSDRGITK